jgi:hypothetical protein
MSTELDITSFEKFVSAMENGNEETKRKIYKMVLFAQNENNRQRLKHQRKYYRDKELLAPIKEMERKEREKANQEIREAMLKVYQETKEAAKQARLKANEELKQKKQEEKLKAKELALQQKLKEMNK